MLGTPSIPCFQVAGYDCVSPNRGQSCTLQLGPRLARTSPATPCGGIRKLYQPTSKEMSRESPSSCSRASFLASLLRSQLSKLKGSRMKNTIPYYFPDSPLNGQDSLFHERSFLLIPREEDLPMLGLHKEADASLHRE